MPLTRERRFSALLYNRISTGHGSALDQIKAQNPDAGLPTNQVVWTLEDDNKYHQLDLSWLEEQGVSILRHCRINKARVQKERYLIDQSVFSVIPYNKWFQLTVGETIKYPASSASKAEIRWQCFSFQTETDS